MRLPVAIVLAAAAATVVLAPAPVHAQTPRVLDSIAERVRPCTACHGQEGRATSEGYFPRIAGKPGGYLLNQLVNFREGRRANAAMTYLVQQLADGYLQEIADHFAGLDLPYPLPRPTQASPEDLARGEALVRHGDESRQIPACVRCHGEAMTGVGSAMPGLLGLPHDYIVGLFGAWRSGQRKAAAPDCMAQLISRLTPADTSAVALWLAAQRVPANSKPAPTIALPLPMECGSGLK